MTGPGRGGKTVPLGNQEPVSSDAKCRMMMKTAPASAFVMSQSQFLLEFLIVPLNDPALLGQFDQVGEGGLCGQGRKPVLVRLLFPSGPFDEQPLLRMGFRLPVIAMGRTHT